MTSIMKFILRIQPQTKERARQGTIAGTNIPIFYTPKKTRMFERAVKDNVVYQMRSEGWEPFAKDVPLHLKVIFIRAIKDKKKWGKFKPVGNDLDNLVKAIGDSLNEVAYYDDTQIVILSAVKVYGENDLIEFSLTELPPAPTDLFSEAGILKIGAANG